MMSGRIIVEIQFSKFPLSKKKLEEFLIKNSDKIKKDMVKPFKEYDPDVRCKISYQRFHKPVPSGRDIIPNIKYRGIFKKRVDR